MKHEWQSIETAPKDGTYLLAVWNNTRSPVYGVVWWENGDWHEYEQDVVVANFTHWMPLPSPPEPHHAE